MGKNGVVILTKYTNLRKQTRRPCASYVAARPSQTTNEDTVFPAKEGVFRFAGSCKSHRWEANGPNIHVPFGIDFQISSIKYKDDHQ